MVFQLIEFFAPKNFTLTLKVRRFAYFFHILMSKAKYEPFLDSR
jgi:hypothetical protein